MHKVEYVLVALSKTIARATSDFVCNPCNPWSKQANTPEARTGAATCKNEFKFALNRVDK